MKTLKENWVDALPVLFGIISIVLLIYILVWGISKVMPTGEELKQRKIDQIESIKMCVDNGLDSYQGGNGDWYCMPKNYK
jgi:hypothetical protein